MTVDNLLKVMERATPTDIIAGAQWYTEAHALADSLSPNDVTIGAGVIAALSPQLSWVINQRIAVEAFRNGYAKGCLGRSCAKATAILNGTPPLDVLGGSKVLSFFDNIVKPHGNAVTIDRHAFDAANSACGMPVTLGRKGEYERYADIYRTAAGILNIAPPTLQAIIWVVWRREKGLGWAG